MKERIQLNKDLLSFILPKYTSVLPEQIPLDELIQEHLIKNAIKELTIDELRELINEQENN